MERKVLIRIGLVSVDDLFSRLYLILPSREQILRAASGRFGLAWSTEIFIVQKYFACAHGDQLRHGNLNHNRANGQPRVLFNDAFGAHESVELVRFCIENNITLCRLASHTSHKLQPCDVGVFGPLKAAYRDQVDQLDLRGAGTVGKEHFTLLYDKAREKAFTPRNIRSGWARAGLCPFNRDKVLRDIPQPQKDEVQPAAMAPPSLQSLVELITPVTSEDVTSVFKRITNVSHLLDDSSRRDLEMLKNAALGALAGKSLLLAQNDLLRKQNDEKNVRKSVRSKVVGTGKVMSYRDSKALEEKRDAKEAAKKLREQRKNRLEASNHAQREMEAQGLADYCSVLPF